MVRPMKARCCERRNTPLYRQTSASRAGSRQGDPCAVWATLRPATRVTSHRSVDPLAIHAGRQCTPAVARINGVMDYEIQGRNCELLRVERGSTAGGDGRIGTLVYLRVAVVVVQVVVLAALRLLSLHFAA